MKRLPSKFRFPMFFAGAVIVILSGILNKYALIGLGETEIGAILGFAILVLSIAA
ncbi:MAG: hypothetical protein M1321_01815 [Candidatus Marsarchaeota archaeon]|nr:hypothetical protein [Candidatus Marsarchaeota archaeon]